MFGIGANELILILLFGFLVFGPDKLPAMAKTIGRAIAKFRNAQSEMNEVIKKEVYDPTADDPFKNPLDALSKLENDAKKEDKAESFTERKARYDKQRAARKAAEARRAQAEAAKEQVAGTSSTTIGSVSTVKAAQSAEQTTGQKEASSAQEKAEGQKPARVAPTVDELYGKPAAKKPSRPAQSAIEAPKKSDENTFVRVTEATDTKGE